MIAIGVAPLAAPALATDSATTSPASAVIDPALARRVNQILAKMGSSDFPTREQATTDAESLPPEALPLLEAASQSVTVSPEVEARLAAILPRLREDAKVAAIDHQKNDVLEWLKNQSISNYQHGGYSNPKWDDAVRDAFALQARLDEHPNTDVSYAQDIIAAYKKAMDLGCKDPFVRFELAEKNIDLLAMPPNVAAHLEQSDVDELEKTGYSDFWKWWCEVQVASRYGACMKTGIKVDPALVAKAVQRSMQLYASAVKQGCPASGIFPLETVMLRVGINTSAQPQEGYDKMIAVLRAAPTPESEIAVLHAEFMFGIVMADKSDPADDRYKQLETELDRAWESDPSNFRIPEEMIRLCDKTNQGIDKMNLWFARGIALNPVDIIAYSRKGTYLRDHADEATVLAFGHECTTTRFAREGVGILPGIDVFIMASGWRGDGPNNDFFDQHPETWDDIQTAFVNYLKAVPDDLAVRSKYANFAARLEHWDVAKAQLAILGDNAFPILFGSKAELDYLKRKIAMHTQQGN